MTGYSDVITFAIQTGIAKDIPTYAEAAMQRGRIIGSVEIIDCVDRSKSPWFEGPFGFVLKDPRPIEPFSCNGRLKFFDVYREELGIK